MDLARTFGDHIDRVATESPHAAIMEWWRRLDLAIADYFSERSTKRPSRREDEEALIAADPNLGPRIAEQIRALRLRRNEIAHEDSLGPSREEAIGFATQAFELIGELCLREP